MIIRILLATVIGGTAIFLWQMVSTMWLPWQTESVRSLPEGAVNTSRLPKLLPGSGVYRDGPDATSSEREIRAWAESIEGKPQVTLLVYAESSSAPFSARQFGACYVADLLAAAAAIAILVLAGLTHAGALHKIFVVTLLGVFAALLTALQDWVWWGFPPRQTLIRSGDLVISAFLAALAIAICVRPAAAKER